MSKYVVGLGCSWTQGQGGYPQELWDQYNGRINLPGKDDEFLRPYEHANSWVNVLCRDYLQDHIPINLGVRACGNRGAVKQLYFSDIDWSKGSGYIIFMVAGLDRFDFLRHDLLKFNYTYNEYKFNTIWPEKTSSDPLWQGYGNHWSEQLVAHETMLALLELQNFCRLYNYELIVANAYNSINLKKYMSIMATPLYKKFDWKCYLHNTTDYIAIVQYLVYLDGVIDNSEWDNFYMNYQEFDKPKTYLTNCSHPTIKGYEVIANELNKFIFLSTAAKARALYIRR